mgnify:CR=1 FL=1
MSEEDTKQLTIIKELLIKIGKGYISLVKVVLDSNMSKVTQHEKYIKLELLSKLEYHFMATAI